MKKLILALSAVVLFMFSSCDGIILNGGLEDLFAWYDTEAATIVYEYNSGVDTTANLTLAFDNKGKRERIEFSSWDGFSGNVVFISNKFDSTYITLAHYYDPIVDTTYDVYYRLENQDVSSAKLLYIGNTAQLVVDTTVYPTYSKVTDTIAGKPCQVMNFIDADSNAWRYGGWKRIIFICELQEYLDYPIEATSFSEEVDSNAFVIPEGYIDVTTMPGWDELEDSFPRF